MSPPGRSKRERERDKVEPSRAVRAPERERGHIRTHGLPEPKCHIAGPLARKEARTTSAASLVCAPFARSHTVHLCFLLTVLGSTSLNKQLQQDSNPAPLAPSLKPTAPATCTLATLVAETGHWYTSQTTVESGSCLVTAFHVARGFHPGTHSPLIVLPSPYLSPSSTSYRLPCPLGQPSSIPILATRDCRRGFWTSKGALPAARASRSPCLSSVTVSPIRIPLPLLQPLSFVVASTLSPPTPHTALHKPVLV